MRVRQPLTARRVGDLLLNNALIIIMIIAVIYIAIRNPNFIKPPSLINIFPRRRPISPLRWVSAGASCLPAQTCPQAEPWD